MLFFLSLALSLLHSILSSPGNTFVFSPESNTYVAFDAWRPCLTGYVRFDIRTTAQDGTLAYIDDRGKFDFFYLKLIQGKPRLLFNLGNDRQALNVNMRINDDRWHTIVIQRNGKLTTLSIDHGQGQSSAITHSEDLFFGGTTYDEYEASPFYFGGIPSVLERPSSGNLSSFDVYMQPRYRGQLRNLVYKNCTSARLVQPIHTELSGSVALIPNHSCSGHKCGLGVCLINEKNYECLCNETNYQGDRCQDEHPNKELTFLGKQYVRYHLNSSIKSNNELLTFQMKTNHHDGVLVQLPNGPFSVKLRQGQLVVEYRSNSSWHESASKDLQLVDSQWHYVQIHRQQGQLTLLIDQQYLPLEQDIRTDPWWTITQIYLAGNDELHQEKFHGCLKDVSIVLNDHQTIEINPSSLNFHSYGYIRPITCQAVLDPIQFLTSSSFISLPMSILSQTLTLSFRFQTYASNGILFYVTNSVASTSDFLGLDVIDGFVSLTMNFHRKKQREELFQQRFNDGQSHYIQLDLRNDQYHLAVNVTVDYRQQAKFSIRHTGSKINLQTLTIGGLNPAARAIIPTNYWSGVMEHGLVGCFSDLEINHELVNLTRYINYTATNGALKSGACSMQLSKRRPCLCEHQGECRLSHGGTWSCDCSKTSYTGRRCEQLAHHLDLNRNRTMEFNTQLRWSEQIDDIAFRLRAVRDEEAFLQVRPCRLSSRCDAVGFSIRNGLLNIHFNSLNINGTEPFLLDQQWHSIHLQRMNTNLLLHIDQHVAQQRVNISSFNVSTSSSIWLVFSGWKQILLEDLRIFDQSIYTKLIEAPQHEKVRLSHQPWKPSNTISLDNHANSYLEVPLNGIVCQECPLETIDFQFRTTESNGLLLFANIQTDGDTVSPAAAGHTIRRDHQYLLLKLVNGELHLTVSGSSMARTDDKIHQVQTKTQLNDGQWHHVSLHRASDHHIEFIVDSKAYTRLISLYILDRVYFGRPSDIYLFNPITTLKACFASLTINNQPVNLREYIRSNAQIRNDCPLDSQCPLRTCQNTGKCLDRIQCQCQHTSFQGRFCTDLKLGYSFHNHTSGLIFDQPWVREKPVLLYQLSFGIVTKMNTAEIIRINEQLQIELYRGCIRIRFNGNEMIRSDRLVNDGVYHLIQIGYNITRYLYVYVDNRLVSKQLSQSLPLDQPLTLLIGQNPAFKHAFQGQLYGLESGAYSVFDLITPAFQRISYASIRNKSLPTSILSPSSPPFDDLLRPSCSYEPYDDICIPLSDTSSSPLSFPNPTILSLTSMKTLPPSSSTVTETRATSRKPLAASTASHERMTYLSYANSTNVEYGISLTTSIGVANSTRLLDKYRWQNIWIYMVAILVGTVLCLLLCICALIKYRRKDAGVYEVEEAQRFRPLIVEMPRSSGEHTSTKVHKQGAACTKTNIKSRKRKKSLLTTADEQREFYI